MFALSKIGWLLLSPLNFILILLIAGILFVLLSRPRFGLSCIFLASILFVAGGLLPLGPDLLAGLERQTARPKELPTKITGIVVLGGTFETELSAHYGFPVVDANIERVMDGLRLAHLRPQAHLIFSGGEGRLAHQDHPETADVSDFIRYYDLPVPPHLQSESHSRNTRENLEFSRALANPKPGETWLLVTSAYHMKRAMMAAHVVGWNMTPWPTSYKTTGENVGFPPPFDVTGNFYELDLALHEYLGLLTYRFGKSAAK